MADDDNAQTQQQAPEPNPALKALEVMVGVWELKGRDFTTNGEIRGRSAFEWLEGGASSFFTTSTSTTPDERSLASSTSATTKRVGT